MNQLNHGSDQDHLLLIQKATLVPRIKSHTRNDENHRIKSNDEDDRRQQKKNPKTPSGKATEHHTDCRGKIVDMVGDEADKQTALPHPGVADQQYLERVIVAVP